MSLLEGKTGLIMGVANRRSIAWGIATAANNAGARLILTYQSERLGENVRELAPQLNNPILLKDCLDSGISVAAINYRYSTQAIAPAPFQDGARAVQFLRSKAKDWNLDPQRFAATGGSAGAGISLWLGFHNDLADPKSEDPVLRQSTRLACMVVRPS